MEAAKNDRSKQLIISFLQSYRGLILWGIALAVVLWIAVSVKEVSSLLLLSYGIATLIEPLVRRCEHGMSRGLAVFSVLILITMVLLLLVLLAIPVFVEQYRNLIAVLPGYLASTIDLVKALLHDHFQYDLPVTADEYKQLILDHLSPEQLKQVGVTLFSTVLSGYSITLTLLNLSLLPFFIYYLSRDLHLITDFIVNLLPEEVRGQSVSIGRQILAHVYAFFRGQLTVAVLMGLCYAVGLTLVGMQSSIVVGILSGLLNIVPYLGITLGIILSSLITLVTEPTWTQFLLVWGVFGVVQFLEGFIFTPKIVGESVGIPALAVIVALMIGGQLFGMLGLILAIPAAAAVRVLAANLLLVKSDPPVPAAAALTQI